jgi:FkbM family methyltransferase
MSVLAAKAVVQRTSLPRFDPEPLIRWTDSLRRLGRKDSYGERHYGMSVRSDWHPSSGMVFEEVETITIDAIAERYLPRRRYPALIKIDIEGAEIEAMKGARGMIEEGALLIYEDRGKEPTHPVSCFVLAETDIVVWRVTSDQRPIPITSIEQVAAIKQDARMGYNFFAHKRESPWSSAFAGAVEGS